jgi:hypothetical protein
MGSRTELPILLIPGEICYAGGSAAGLLEESRFPDGVLLLYFQ